MLALDRIGWILRIEEEATLEKGNHPMFNLSGGQI